MTPTTCVTLCAVFVCLGCVGGAVMGRSPDPPVNARVRAALWTVLGLTALALVCAVVGWGQYVSPRGDVASLPRALTWIVDAPLLVGALLWVTARHCARTLDLLDRTAILCAFLGVALWTWAVFPPGHFAIAVHAYLCFIVVLVALLRAFWRAAHCPPSLHLCLVLGGVLLLWALYPVAWLLYHGGALSATGRYSAYLLIDVGERGILPAWLLTHRLTAPAKGGIMTRLPFIVAGLAFLVLAFLLGLTSTNTIPPSTLVNQTAGFLNIVCYGSLLLGLLLRKDDEIAHVRRLEGKIDAQAGQLTEVNADSLTRTGIVKELITVTADLRAEVRSLKAALDTDRAAGTARRRAKADADKATPQG